MKPTTALRASARVGQDLSEHVSFLSVAKKDSATALSWQEPVRPTEGLTPLASAHPAGRRLVYWAPRSLWKIAFPAT